jgi:hypothetical protein
MVGQQRSARRPVVIASAAERRRQTSFPARGPSAISPLQRGGKGAGQQRLLRRERITPRLRVQPPPAAARQAPHVGMGGRKGR